MQRFGYTDLALDVRSFVFSISPTSIILPQSKQILAFTCTLDVFNVKNLVFAGLKYILP